MARGCEAGCLASYLPVFKTHMGDIFKYLCCVIEKHCSCYFVDMVFLCKPRDGMMSECCTYMALLERAQGQKGMACTQVEQGLEVLLTQHLTWVRAVLAKASWVCLRPIPAYSPSMGFVGGSSLTPSSC